MFLEKIQEVNKVKNIIRTNTKLGADEDGREYHAVLSDVTVAERTGKRFNVRLKALDRPLQTIALKISFREEEVNEVFKSWREIFKKELEEFNTKFEIKKVQTKTDLKVIQNWTN